MQLRSGTPVRMCVCGWAPLTQLKRLQGSMTRLRWQLRAPTPASTSLRARRGPLEVHHASVLLERYGPQSCSCEGLRAHAPTPTFIGARLTPFRHHRLDAAQEAEYITASWWPVGHLDGCHETVPGLIQNNGVHRYMSMCCINMSLTQ